MEKFIVKVTTNIKLCQKIRLSVFIKQFHLKKAEELDIYDNIATHFLCYLTSRAVGTARLVVCNGAAILSRVAVLPGFQGMGVGGSLMHQLEHRCNLASINTIYLTSTAPKFHERFGYVSSGKKYIDGGIFVTEMKKTNIKNGGRK